MKYNIMTLIGLTILLTGCGSGSSTPPSPPQPAQTKIIAVTLGDKQPANNTVLTNGVITSAQSNVSSSHIKETLSDEPNLHINVNDSIEVEYTGPIPTLPVSKSQDFQFDSIQSIICTHPINPTDSCITTDVTFMPQKTSDNVLEPYFDGLLQLHGYVPFRIFPITDTPSLVTGTPLKPNFDLKFTPNVTVEGLGTLTFNDENKPSTANFTNKDIKNNDGSGTLINIPFTLKENSDQTIEATYQCTQKDLICESDFMSPQAPLLKKYDLHDSQLTYSSAVPTNTKADAGIAISVQLTLTRAFVITTDEGEVYALENPTSNHLSLLGFLTNQSGEPTVLPFEVYTHNKSITNVTLGIRTSLFSDILDPMAVGISKTTDPVWTFGQITGKNYDMTLSDMNTPDNGAINFLARSRFSLGNGGDEFVASLINSTTPTVSSYQLVVTTNDPGVTSTHPSIDIEGIPALEDPMIVITSANVEEGSNNYHANILISGLNTESNKQESYYGTVTYIDPNKNNGSANTFTQLANPNANTMPIVFDYNIYTNGIYPTMYKPEQKMVFMNSADTILTIMGDTSSSTIPKSTSINLAANNISGIPLAFACSDTDITKTTTDNTCYLLMRNDAAHLKYAMYQLTNVNPDANTTITPTITLIANTPQPDNIITKALIDGNTGEVFTMEKDNININHLELFSLNHNTYNSGQAVTLPVTPEFQKADQSPTGIYEY